MSHRSISQFGCRNCLFNQTEWRNWHPAPMLDASHKRTVVKESADMSDTTPSIETWTSRLYLSCELENFLNNSRPRKSNLRKVFTSSVSKTQSRSEIQGFASSSCHNSLTASNTCTARSACPYLGLWKYMEWKMNWVNSRVGRERTKTEQKA